jgi:anaerobic selenocysteine-containing dehydrogenase
VVVPGCGTRTLSLRQPAVRPLGNTVQTGEVILRLAAAVGGAVAEALPWRSYREAVEAGLAKVSGGAGEVLAALDGQGVWEASSEQDDSAESGAGERQGLLDVGGALPGDAKAAAGESASFPFVLVPFRGAGYAEGGMRHLPWLCELPLAARDFCRPHIEISPQDARELGIEDGAGIVVATSFARVEMQAWVHDGIRPGVLGLPMGGGAWPDAAVEPAAASLLASSADEKTGQWHACATRARLEKGA